MVRFYITDIIFGKSIAEIFIKNTVLYMSKSKSNPFKIDSLSSSFYFYLLFIQCRGNLESTINSNNY